MAERLKTLRLLLGGNVRFPRQRLGESSESSILGVNGLGGFGKEVLEDPWDWYIIPIHEGLIFMGSIHGW